MENMEENFPTKFDKRKPKGNHTPKIFSINFVTLFY